MEELNRREVEEREQEGGIYKQSLQLTKMQNLCLLENF